jgi:hypothetical protein
MARPWSVAARPRLRSLRLSVRTPPFHGGESGSIPLGSASVFNGLAPSIPTVSNKRPRTPIDNPVPIRPEDVLNKGIRAGIGALPVVGSALTEFLAFVVGEPAMERRDDFMKATLERVLELESEFDELDREALRNNEQFQATFIQATRLSTQAASDEKRQMLRNTTWSRFTIVHIGGMISHARPSAENHLWRAALRRRSRHPHVSRGLSLQPLDRDNCGPVAGRYPAVRQGQHFNPSDRNRLAP